MLWALVGMQLIHDIVGIFKEHNLPTRVLSASIRHPLHAYESAKGGGAYAGTMPFKVSMPAESSAGQRGGYAGFQVSTLGCNVRVVYELISRTVQSSTVFATTWKLRPLPVAAIRLYALLLCC